MLEVEQFNQDDNGGDYSTVIRDITKELENEVSDTGNSLSGKCEIPDCVGGRRTSADEQSVDTSVHECAREPVLEIGQDLCRADAGGVVVDVNHLQKDSSHSDFVSGQNSCVKEDPGYYDWSYWRVNCLSDGGMGNQNTHDGGKGDGKKVVGGVGERTGSRLSLRGLGLGKGGKGKGKSGSREVVREEVEGDGEVVGVEGVEIVVEGEFLIYF